MLRYVRRWVYTYIYRILVYCRIDDGDVEQLHCSGSLFSPRLGLLTQEEKKSSYFTFFLKPSESI